MTRHEFLAQLHETLKPRGYLEVGVYSGDSLRLVRPGTPAIGIDPAPMLLGHFPGTTQVFRVTSDDFFDQKAEYLTYLSTMAGIDLAFIDGMHLYEYALRDFRNIEKYANPRTVVVFDDVLPRNQHEASRTQCPGDWTGDVWKVPRVLAQFRTDLEVYPVDTAPTGTAVVYGFGRSLQNLDEVYEGILGLGFEKLEEVPDIVLERVDAHEPQDVLSHISYYLEGLE